jgi:prepilin-type N-terminal cleavage/methylation domain-containing protein
MSRLATPTARRHRIWSSQRGISLIETMVALGVFAISAAGINSFLTQHVRRSAGNHLQTVAYGLAEDTLEAARTLDWEDIATKQTTHAEGGVTFTIALAVQNDTPAENLKTLTATVSWTDPLGAQSIQVPVVYTQVTRF